MKSRVIVSGEILPSWISFRKSLESNILIGHILPFFIVYILYHIFLFLSRNISEIKIGHAKPAKIFHEESFSSLFFWIVQWLLDHSRSICSSCGKKFFLPYLTIILYHIFFILSNASFQLDLVAYLICSRSEGRETRPGQIFFLFGKKLIRFRARPSSTFVSNGPGLREVGSARPGAARFQRKMGAYGTFSGVWGPLDPQMLQKCYKFYKKMTKI